MPEVRLFIGNVPRDAQKADVVRLFSAFGATEESVVLPRDRRTRRKKGIAYVIVPDSAKADAAIAAFNGFEIEGKPLTVSVAANNPKIRRAQPVQRR